MAIIFGKSLWRRGAFPVLVCGLAWLVMAVAAHATEPRKAAIFVANRSDKKFDDQLAAFEDLISSHITEKGFTVVSREVATDALSSLKKDSKPTDADQLLSDNSSVLRLGQLLGVDYLILASITSYGVDKKTVDAYGEKFSNVTHNLRVTYKILDGTRGSTLASDTVKASKTMRQTATSQEDDGDLINGLLDEASVLVADSVGKKEIKTVVLAQDQVEFSIACGMQDLANVPLSIPDVQVTDDKVVKLGKTPLDVQALDVTVELDGVVLGSAPGSFKSLPGLHKIRLTREGFKPWERTINIAAGQKLKVALQMTDTGYQRWKDNTAFLQALEDDKKLTDAQAEKIRGIAQMFRQSGYKVDVKADIKSDVKRRSIF